jgi:hypothetical protein
MKSDIIQISLCLMSIVWCVVGNAVISSVFFIGACVIWALKDKP